MKRTLVIGMGLLALATAGRAQAAKAPSAAKVSKDVTAYWHKTWPDQELAHVGRKSEACEPGEVEVKRRGKPRKVKTCLLKADVFVAKGYRYLIYRDTEVHYQGRRLVSVQLGELEKAWKSGGVPAPTQEQALAMLQAEAVRALGEGAQVTIREMGIPRPFGEVYRVSLVVDVAYTLDGKPAKREHVLVTFESDGGDWRPVPDLMF